MSARRPAPFGRVLREAGRLIAHRQRLVVIPVVVMLLEAGVTALLSWPTGRATSFSSVARAVFDDATTVDRAVRHLSSSRLGLWAALIALIAGQALIDGVLRSSYLLALGTDGHPRWAPARTMRRLAAYSLLFGVLQLGIAVMVAEGYALSILAFVAVTILGFYADYAIVLDELSLADGLRRNLQVVRARPSATLGIVVLSVIAFNTIGALFNSGFMDASHVQPTYLLAYELSLAVATFIVDVVLICVYRSTPVAPAPASSA